MLNTKEPNKILVWIAIFEFGINAVVARLAKSESIDQHVYLHECSARNTNDSFWSDLAQWVYDNGWQGKNEAHLIARIKLKLKGFDQTYQ